mmetsp:Transcript_15133/g.43045  ORF Transcript_15133/g.43045 Transcript_15133/m.43045 type:complete len:232 (-) Transcript_15133:3616-4311(-)
MALTTSAASSRDATDVSSLKSSVKGGGPCSSAKAIQVARAASSSASHRAARACNACAFAADPSKPPLAISCCATTVLFEGAFAPDLNSEASNFNLADSASASSSSSLTSLVTRDSTAFDSMVSSSEDIEHCRAASTIAEAKAAADADGLADTASRAARRNAAPHSWKSPAIETACSLNAALDAVAGGATMTSTNAGETSDIFARASGATRDRPISRSPDNARATLSLPCFT